MNLQGHSGRAQKQCKCRALGALTLTPSKLPGSLALHSELVVSLRTEHLLRPITLVSLSPQEGPDSLLLKHTQLAMLTSADLPLSFQV